MSTIDTRKRPVVAVMALVLAISAPTVLLAPEASAQGEGQTQVTGTLWVEGGSTVRSWDCAAGQLNVELTSRAGSQGDFALDGLAEAVTGLRVGIPAAGLDCDDNTMNGHMRDALDIERHSIIEFQMESYRILNGADGPQVELVGTLQIKGETRPAQMSAQVEVQGEGLRVRGVHTLNMTDFGVKPPRLMFGALRVHEDVEVHFDLLMSRSGS